MFDEGHKHTGKAAIKNWIEKANQTYRATMKPLQYNPATQTLEAEIAGNFPGSPLVITYHFELEHEKIQSLKIV